jgi:hypothetical protein
MRNISKFLAFAVAILFTAYVFYGYGSKTTQSQMSATSYSIGSAVILRTEALTGVLQAIGKDEFDPSKFASHKYIVNMLAVDFLSLQTYASDDQRKVVCNAVGQELSEQKLRLALEEFGPKNPWGVMGIEELLAMCSIID